MGAQLSAVLWLVVVLSEVKVFWVEGVVKEVQSVAELMGVELE